MVTTLVTLWIGFAAGLVAAALLRAAGPGGASSVAPYLQRRRLTRARH